MGSCLPFADNCPFCEVQPLALPTKHEVEPHACKLGLGSSSGAEVNFSIMGANFKPPLNKVENMTVLSWDPSYISPTREAMGKCFPTHRKKQIALF